MGTHSLKPIFYGLAYTPFNALEPWCGANLNNVTEDILLMSQMTSTLFPPPSGGYRLQNSGWTDSGALCFQLACACTARPATRRNWSFKLFRTRR